ncbi:ras/Rap GTPase-activating protein SynGAP [Pimephales promelas]|nr:ras/Rap GTPase-activating protein SynGAP [Pimephales promelas]
MLSRWRSDDGSSQSELITVSAGGSCPMCLHKPPFSNPKNRQERPVESVLENVWKAHVLRVQLPEEEDSHLQGEREGLHPSRLPRQRRVGSLFQNSSLLSSRFHAVLKHFHLTPTSLPFLFLSFIIPLSLSRYIGRFKSFFSPLGRGRHGNRLGVCERERESGRHGNGRCVSPCSRPHTPLNGHTHDSPGWSRQLRVRDGDQFYLLDQEEVHPLLMNDHRHVSHRHKLLRRTVSVPADSRPHPETDEDEDDEDDARAVRPRRIIPDSRAVRLNPSR